MQAIDLNMNNDFTYARWKLVTLYLLIIGSIILIFSLLIVYQAGDSFSDPAVKSSSDVLFSATEAENKARDLFTEKKVVETEYEIENGVLYYTVLFDDETEVKIDLLTGSAYVPEEKDNFIETFTDDFEERVGLIAFVLFVSASLLCIYVANLTLIPVAKSIRKQKQFVSDAAHELRNPLAALHARIESALLPGTEFETDIFEDLLSETKRLVSLSENLLALERVEHTVRQSELLDIQEVVSDVLSRLQFYITDKHLQVIINIDNTGLNFYRLDFETILYNLLHNAIKFSRVNGTISITWTNHSLAIADNGIGIAQEKLPYIFDRFYKADIARSEEGSGLGLALVREIIDRNRGTISVLSTNTTGTTITIQFKNTASV